jgi:hypothetical protein
MNRNVKVLALTGTHVFAVLSGFAIGIYLLPILTAPESPGADALQSTVENALFTGEFRRDLEDSDAFHWGEGKLFVSRDAIAFEGRLSPGPDYRLYLSPEFVETEEAFEALKPSMVQAGMVQTFENFMITVPESIDTADYNTAIVWCESFGQFITAAAYD